MKITYCDSCGEEITEKTVINGMENPSSVTFESQDSIPYANVKFSQEILKGSVKPDLCIKCFIGKLEEHIKS
jgi:ribosomal protein S26